MAQKRAAIFVDGQNWFHLLEKYGLDGRAFHFKKFAEEYLCAAVIDNEKNKNYPSKEIHSIRYYGARFPRELSLEKHNRDDAYYQALEKFQNVRVVEGRFRIDNITVQGRKPPNNIERVAQEKGVDVRLATDLIIDAFYHNYDIAYVLSGDTDIVPAIEQIKILRPELQFFCCVDPILSIHRRVYHGSIRVHKELLARYIDPKWFPATPTTIDALKSKFAPVS